nr:4Fe-4S binding protein [Candidatus Sigynarchaeota archaeon]
MVARNDAAYDALQKHLDKMPLGFPRTRSGSYRNVLKFIFRNEDEVRVAIHMSYKPESIKTIHERIGGMSLETVQSALESMERHGGVMKIERDGEPRYYLHPFLPGMLEYGILGEYRDKGSIATLHDNTDDFMFKYVIDMFCAERRPFREIPIEASLTPEHGVATYDELYHIINSCTKFGVLHCMCRLGSKLYHDGCKKTDRLESCMVFNDYAASTIKVGIAREITKEQAMEIARKNEMDGLVLQPENTQNPGWMCSCCSCCCGFLHMLKSVPRPADFVHGNFHATIDSASCIGCGTCVKRCQMDAITIGDGKKAQINEARCIGCGLCVPTCKKKAARLVRNAADYIPPVNLDAYKDLLMEKKKGRLGRAGVLLKMLLKMKQ